MTPPYNEQIDDILFAVFLGLICLAFVVAAVIHHLKKQKRKR